MYLHILICILRLYHYVFRVSSNDTSVAIVSPVAPFQSLDARSPKRKRKKRRCFTKDSSANTLTFNTADCIRTLPCIIKRNAKQFSASTERTRVYVAILSNCLVLQYARRRLRVSAIHKQTFFIYSNALKYQRARVYSERGTTRKVSHFSLRSNRRRCRQFRRDNTKFVIINDSSRRL